MKLIVGTLMLSLKFYIYKYVHVYGTHINVRIHLKTAVQVQCILYTCTLYIALSSSWLSSFENTVISVCVSGRITNTFNPADG